MPASKSQGAGGGQTPCRLPVEEWSTCYADGCYLNHCCPSYRGSRPNPPRDYLPLPPVFLRLGPYEAIPYSYTIPRLDPDGEW